VLPTERLRGADDAVREVLVTSPSPRLVTALAPVLVHNVDRVNLKALHLRLASAGLERRLAWVVENTLQALREELPSVKDARQRRAYTRAQKPAAPDVLDAGIRSKRTLDEVAAGSSDISKRWGIVTAIHPEDFARALRGARAAGA
jgi:hypothetical protein